MAVLWAAFRARDLHPRFGLFPTQGDNNLKKSSTQLTIGCLYQIFVQTIFLILDTF